MKAYAPFQVTIGRLCGAFQSTGVYDVLTDFGRYSGTYLGTPSSPGGVMGGGGLQPGCFVWVLFGIGEQDCQILGPVIPAWQPDAAADPQQFSVYPQVSGFRLGAGLTGRLFELGVEGMSNHPTDVMKDLVNGEWSVASPHGPGVGVELFRSWIRGSPMTGVTCFDDLTRITGLDYEFITLAQQDYDRRHGNSITQVKSRVLYPDEALNDLPGRDITISGAIHGGEHRFIAPQGTTPVQRDGLLHEFRGIDGTFAITSARAVILRRSTAIKVPYESKAVGEGALLGDQPLDPDTDRETALAHPPATIQENPSSSDGISWIQHALDTVYSEVNVRGKNGFDRLPIQWPAGQAQQDTLHTSYDPQMWRSLPRAFEITIDPIEESKTFYVGESMVQLCPDGSVVIQDAHHSQIIMGGGNIVLSCAHDIVLAPGRNLVGIAGSDCSLKANRHIDVAANEGRVSVKAETQLGLLGGNGQTDGGVLIESRAKNEGLVVGTGVDQNIGGILLKSATGLYGTGSRIALDATDENVTIRAAGGIIGLAAQCQLELSDGMFVFKDADGNGAYAFTDTGCTIPGSLAVNGPVDVLGDGFFDGQIIASSNIAAGGSVSGSSVGAAAAGDKTVDNFARLSRSAINGSLASLVKSIKVMTKNIASTFADKLPLNRALASLVGFSFATSEQLRTNTKGAFKLPETLWQAISRRASKGASKVWSENSVTSPSGDNRPTSPSPGHEAWSVSASYELSEHDLYFDLETGLPIATPPASNTIPDASTLPLNHNFRIGND